MKSKKSFVILVDQFSEGDLRKLVDTLGLDKDSLAETLVKLPGMPKALKKERAEFIEDRFPGNYVPDASEMNHANLDAGEHINDTDVIIKVADRLLTKKNAELRITTFIKRSK